MNRLSLIVRLAGIAVLLAGTVVLAAQRQPIKVGGNIAESKLIHRVEPIYPELAKKARVSGNVILQITTNEEGFVTDARVTSGHPLLNDSAIAAVKQWRYSPTLLNGQPVPIVGSGEKLHSFIAARDVAQFAVAALDHPAARNQKLVLGGPQGLCYLDAVKTYENVLGRPVPVLRLQPGEPVPGLQPDHGGMLAGFDLGDWVVPMEETARTFGVRLTSLEEFVRGMVSQAA